MAMDVCKECGASVSTKAKTCPHCGAGSPTRTGEAARAGCVSVLIAFGLLIGFGDYGPTEEQEEISKQRCGLSAKCWTDKHYVDATARCAMAVERSAKYDHEWTNGFAIPRFEATRSRAKGEGHISFGGDKARFQNGFGAWQNVSYECDYDPETQSLLDVRVDTE